MPLGSPNTPFLMRFSPLLNVCFLKEEDLIELYLAVNVLFREK